VALACRICSSRDGQDANFPALAVAQIDMVCPDNAKLCRTDRPDFVPPPDAWLHEPFAGNAAVANHSKNRITWRNLVFSDEDFARQYFQVIYGKQFINPNDYGTFDD
jgi:hypothetical protein